MGEGTPLSPTLGQPDEAQHLAETPTLGGLSRSAPWVPRLMSMPSIPLWTASLTHLIFLHPSLCPEADLDRRHHWASLPTSFPLPLANGRHLQVMGEQGPRSLALPSQILLPPPKLLLAGRGGGAVWTFCFSCCSLGAGETPTPLSLSLCSLDKRYLPLAPTQGPPQPRWDALALLASLQIILLLMSALYPLCTGHLFPAGPCLTPPPSPPINPLWLWSNRGFHTQSEPARALPVQVGADTELPLDGRLNKPLWVSLHTNHPKSQRL